MNYYIEFLDGPDPPSSHRLTLPEGVAISIGRGSDCHWVIADRSVSSRHCEIELSDDGRVTLTDLGSRNGTYVGSQKIRQVEIESEAEIRIGKTVIQFVGESIANDEAGRGDSGTFEKAKFDESDIHLEAKESPTELTKLDPAPVQSDVRTQFSSSLWGDSVLADRRSMESDANSTMAASPPLPEPTSVNLRAAAPTEPIERSGAEPASSSPFSSVENEPDEPTGYIRSVALNYHGTDGEPDEIRIRVGQTVVVGGSPLADVAIGQMNLQPRHFKVVCQRDSVVVERLGKRASLIVNQATQSKAFLKHGDRVLAGEVSFEVEIDGDNRLAHRSTSSLPSPSTATSDAAQISSRLSSASIASSSLPKPDPARQANVELEVAMESNESSTGVACCLGEAKAIPVEQLLRRFAKKRNLSILLDPVRLGSPNDPELNQHLLARDESGTIKTCWCPLPNHGSIHTWMERIYGNDCGVILVSKLDPNELVERLAFREGDNASLIEICWPSLFRAMLTSFEKRSVDAFFRAVDFVIMESESPREWSIFGKADSINALADFGLSIPDEPLDKSKKDKSKKELANA